MIEALVSIILVLASALMLVAAVGIIRLPDLVTRLHATTKSGVLAITLIMIAVAVFFSESGVTTRVMAIIVFTFITAPVAAHAIGRAGYFSGVGLWEKTKKDQLKEYYERQNSNEP
ncbi:monovalent cation/H(+) antiporter subunit G [Salinibius halmophilus]|uniref:monovalent cation/H(+) antiporter subunit G n=1 Tax=Salinibius halmophilus TaxID=1853216 RepID=UPI000E666F30|nr:monovalent cation/H(+) antiporter subunit G [Salinibius halmophilus]